jgi:hypothetical protein
VTGVKKLMPNVRKWPASYSTKVGELEAKDHVWSNAASSPQQGGADWCLVERGDEYGWSIRNS